MEMPAMAKENLCEKCSEKKSCEEAYKQLGQAKGPSVVVGAIVAFVVPIVVFIASLAACEQILTSSIQATKLRLVLSFLLALVVTIALIMIMQVINKRLTKTDNPRTI